MQNRTRNTELIKRKAVELGFDEIGVSKAAFLDNEARELEDWLQQGRHGQMSYMSNHFDKRLDPTLLVPGAKSVVSLSYNYYTDKKQIDSHAPKLSSYAYGRDYHKVVKKKLQHLMRFIREEIGEVDGRCFVDSAPVMERAWAKKSGIGWIGKNSLMLTKGKGSYFFLAELIIDLELDVDGPVKDYCGSCTKCVDACPTDAIYEPYQVDGSKCISYFTIELKDELPNSMKNKFENWMFGCDICQQVCPINARSKQHKEPDFEPHEDLLGMKKKDWEEITEEVFDKVFMGTPVKRATFKGLKRNIKFFRKMKKIIPFLLIVATFFSACSKEELINARVSGVYNVYIKAQSDFWIEDLAINYNEDTEMNGFASWDGVNAPKTIRILIDKVSKNRMDFTIPEQTYEGESSISGTGIHVNGNIEFYYIIGNSNLSRSYVMNGNR